MLYSKTHQLKKGGETIELRSAGAADAEAMIELLNKVDRQTKYLSREPGEFTASIEEEANWLKNAESDETSLQLIAFHQGEAVGCCGISPIAAKRRFVHRAVLGMMVEQGFQGRGLGRLMLETSIGLCKQAGFEQLELEVVAQNLRAIALYSSLGFEVVGRMPNALKYADGSRAAVYDMVKPL
ncbi:MAG: GNAT family N-acetyltransferase [Christensenellaceae bacterium]|jgi:ribosomal protein S18 acetylase RimI-like enzyme|nr:GNAT family N-acetyltransferase [Christensenellaceae bacterium]